MQTKPLLIQTLLLRISLCYGIISTLKNMLALTFNGIVGKGDIHLLVKNVFCKTSMILNLYKAVKFLENTYKGFSTSAFDFTSFPNRETFMALQSMMPS